jgi:hypothetical protein
VRTSDINGIQINGNDDWYVILLSNWNITKALKVLT